MKTSDLIGPALDWAVAKCEQPHIEPDDFMLETWHPSTNWAQGGPIIEREKIRLWNYDDPLWEASIAGMPEGKYKQYGPTPLIAAMRCYVASKLGDDVDLPNELIGLSN